MQVISKIIREDSSKFSAINIKHGREGKMIVEFNSKQDLNNALCALKKFSSTKILFEGIIKTSPMNACERCSYNQNKLEWKDLFIYFFFLMCLYCCTGEKSI